MIAWFLGLFRRRRPFADKEPWSALEQRLVLTHMIDANDGGWRRGK